MAISSVSGPTIKAMVANTTGRRFLSSVTLAGIRTGSIVAPAATIRYYQHISTQNSSLPSSKKNKRDSPQHQQIREFSFSYGSGSNKAKSEAGLIPQAVRNETPEQLMHESHPMPMRDEFMGSKRLTTADLEAIPIDLKFHREPTCFSDRVAYHVVKSMRIPVDLFFRTKYIHRVVALETVAAVPGMVAGMLRHLRSLRRCSHDGGWISHLLHEAENERMHLLTWMKVSQPTLFERALVTTVQGVFFNIFFALYMVSDRTAHRVVGYLEEQAVISYTHMLEEIDTGILADGPAPKIAIDYWNLEETATIRDVCLAIRLDEAVHMHTNHHLSDRIALKQEDLRVDIAKLQEERGMVPNENAEKVWSKPNKY
ncbi:Alternative oxidase, mitochondrial precursor [Lunasporangiospora selenospora]|uniref:Alternative oxidase n=1 Tax=Lunasporangiospora selenospora TaxID=979761 RepID=A0A9P6FYA9_9FUNG|nr:Alternative oxidase, mitochondrial precursor [Lunasporangiospora selenospora]